MRRLITGLGLLLLVSATPACLLYTDRINTPPTVAIALAAELHPGVRVEFQAQGSDPDGDQVTYLWRRVDGAKVCTDVQPQDWARAPVFMGPSMEMVPGHHAFCLHLVARDSGGAETVVERMFQPANRKPIVVVDLAEPVAPAAPPYPLFTAFRLSCERTTDLDGDDMTYSWEVRDPSGAVVPPAACPGNPSPKLECFRAEMAGTYLATATVEDGWEQGLGTISLAVGEDQPPCIEATDPAVETVGVVLAVTEPPRRFEVRRVRDDGDPFPPAGARGTSFRWYTARENGPWTRQPGYEAATFDVSAATFEDGRPGSVFRVRVEARDPAHDNPAALRELEECGDQRVCERPARCVRWVGWKVQLQ